MRKPTKIAVGIAITILLVFCFIFVMRSLIGFLMATLLVVCVNDVITRRYRQAVKTFNSAALAVCQQQGAIGKVATAFARSGPLRGPCYEYARRLMIGEDPIESAVRSGVPLHLTTAVAMKSKKDPAANDKLAGNKSDAGYSTYGNSTALVADDASVMPAYAQMMYLVMTALVTSAVITFTAIFVAPTMEKMMDEFGLSQPSMWISSGSFLLRFVLIGIIGFLLAICIVVSWGSFLGFTLPRWLPVSPRAVEDKSDTLRGLADAIDTGMTVDQALSLGAQISVSTNEQKSLSYANRMISQGVSPADALHRSGWLSRGEHAWLQGATIDRGADLLRIIADQRVRDAHANMRWMLGIIFPAVILLLGFTVLAYSAGFFGSLVSLVEWLS